MAEEAKVQIDLDQIVIDDAETIYDLIQVLGSIDPEKVFRGTEAEQLQQLIAVVNRFDKGLFTRTMALLKKCVVGQDAGKLPIRYLWGLIGQMVGLATGGNSASG